MTVDKLEIRRDTLRNTRLVPVLNALKRISEPGYHISCELIEPLEFTPAEEIEICENCKFDSQAHPMTPTPGKNNNFTKLCILELVKKGILVKNNLKDREMAKKIDPAKIGISPANLPETLGENAQGIQSSGASPAYYDQETGKPLPLEYLRERIIQTGTRIEKLSVQMMLDLYFIHLNWFGEYGRADSFRDWVNENLPISYSYTYDIIKIVEMLMKYRAEKAETKFENLMGEIEEPVRKMGVKRLKLIAQVVEEKRGEVLDGLFSGNDMTDDEILAVNRKYWDEMAERNRAMLNRPSPPLGHQPSPPFPEPDGERSRDDGNASVQSAYADISTTLDDRSASGGDAVEHEFKEEETETLNLVRENENFKVSINEPEESALACLWVSAKGENEHLDETPVLLAQFDSECSVEILEAVADAVLEKLTKNEGRAFWSGEKKTQEKKDVSRELNRKS